jgi:hypothetical protein
MGHSVNERYLQRDAIENVLAVNSNRATGPLCIGAGNTYVSEQKRNPGRSTSGDGIMVLLALVQEYQLNVCAASDSSERILRSQIEALERAN